ncbi:MAG: AAA family ATPase [Burkholderiales bacterium]|nr:AAA family ATPase [Burkholderiales bacterium]
MLIESIYAYRMDVLNKSKSIPFESYFDILETDKHKNGTSQFMIKPLAKNQLYTACDIDQFDFKTTDQLEDLKEIIGQDRALKALHLGVNIQHEGYNLFVLGPTGLGKHTVVREYLEALSKSRETPPDWVYVNNFDKPSEPIAISLTSEHASIFRDDMHQLVEDLCSAIPSAFETDEYHLRLQEIDDDLKKTIESAFGTLNGEAGSKQYAAVTHTAWFCFCAGENNEVINPKSLKRCLKRTAADRRNNHRA